MVRWTAAEKKILEQKAAREKVTISEVIREAVLFDFLLSGYPGMWREVSKDAVRQVIKKGEEILERMRGPALRESRSR